jgi:hypothetical protein
LTRDQQPMSHCREGVRIFVSEVWCLWWVMFSWSTHLR